MHNSVAVQVLDGLPNLVRNLLDTLLCKLEVPNLNVVEEVFALHVLQHDVVVI